MIAFLYDKTFGGLLAAVFDAYTQRRVPDFLLGPKDTSPMTVTVLHHVVGSKEKSERVSKGLAKILSRKAMSDLMLAWLSEEPGSDMAVFRYIRKSFDRKCSPEHDLADPEVLAVAKLAKKSGTEVHKLAGFVRFQKTAQDVYFAALLPKHNVLTLLLPHFVDRFTDQRWILYDMERRYGFFFDGKGFQDVFLDAEIAGQLSRQQGKLDAALLEENEPLFQVLWKSYFKATSITERLNPSQQRRCMPRRYWKYLTEKQE